MPTQTPGPRKFAPPASSSSARSTAFSAASARFARPSQPTSSPFTRTPFSSNVRKDEIEIDDDDEDSHDEPEEADLNPPQHQLNRVAGPHRGRLDASTTRDAAAKFHDTTANRQSTASLVQTGQLSTGSKRRKISHFRPGAPDEESDLLDSSLPSSSPTRDTKVFDQEREQGCSTRLSRPSSPLDYQTSEDIHTRPAPARSSSPPHTDEESPGKEFVTPKLRTSRFRNPLTQSSQAITTRNPANTSVEQPLPSFQSRLLAAATASSPGPHLRGPHPSLDFVLPDAFSPSRRRGQNEYVEHGHAETVRSWVLDIAARSGISESSHIANRHVSTDVDDNIFNVTEVVHRDRDDRFAIVRTADHDYTWMLVDTDPKPQQLLTTGAIPKSRLERLHRGSRFVLKGGHVSNWMLDTTDHSIPGNRSETEQGDSAGCRVVVLWDLIH